MDYRLKAGSSGLTVGLAALGRSQPPGARWVADALINVRRNAHYHGWAAASQILFLALLRRVIGFERVLLFYLEQSPPGMAAPSSERVRLATISELEQLSQDALYDMSDLTSEQIHHLYGLGHRCVLNIVEGTVAGYSWMSPLEVAIPKLKIGFPLSVEEAYIYKGFTHSRFRGRNLGVERFLFWLAYLKETGRSRIICDFAFDNKATLTRVNKLHMKQVGVGTWVRIGSFEKLVLKDELRSRTIHRL